MVCLVGGHSLSGGILGKKYNRRRIYQYIEDDFLIKFLFKFCFLPSFQTAWVHIKIKTQRSVKQLLFVYL